MDRMANCLLLVSLVASYACSEQPRGVATEGPDAGKPDAGSDASEPGDRPTRGEAPAPSALGPRTTPTTDAWAMTTAWGPEPTTCPLVQRDLSDPCWSEPTGYREQKLTAERPGLREFGFAIGLHDDTLAVLGRDPILFLYEREGTQFQLASEVSFADAKPGGVSAGHRVAVSADTVVVLYDGVVGTEDLLHSTWLLVFERSDGGLLTPEYFKLGEIRPETAQLALHDNLIVYAQGKASGLGLLERVDGTWKPGTIDTPDLTPPFKALAIDATGVVLADGHGALALLVRDGDAAFQVSDRRTFDGEGGVAALSMSDGLVTAVGTEGDFTRYEVLGGKLQVALGGRSPCYTSGAVAGNGELFAVGRAGYAWALRLDGSGEVQARQLTPSRTALPGPSFGAAVAVAGDTIAVSAPRDGDWGVANGAVHIYQRTNDVPEEICRESKNTRVDGDGLECREYGVAPLHCDRLATSDLVDVSIEGTTPFGPLSLSHGRLHSVYGFTPSSHLRFSTVPVRDDSLPSLSFGFALGDPATTVEVEALLELCEGTAKVPVTVTFARTQDFSRSTDGSLRIDADGWDVEGSFHLAEPCTRLSPP